MLQPRSFDMVFIDGDHSYEGARYDIEHSLPLLRPGGILVLHDYDRESRLGPEYAEGELALGVTRAVDELGLPFRLVDTLAILQPTAELAATAAR